MKLLIGNDLHIGSKHATHTLQELYDVLEYNLLITNEKVIFAGDIFDLANCKRSEVGYWITWANAVKKDVEENGGTFLLGNHELNQIDAANDVFFDGIYVCHGDLGFFWPVEKAMKYRLKDPGAGFLKRTASQYYDVFRKLKPFKPDAQFYAACDKVIAEHNPRVIILAHFHPEENIDFMYKTTRILILKRGIQEIEI